MLTNSLTFSTGSGLVEWGGSKIYALFQQIGGYVVPKNVFTLAFRFGAGDELVRVKSVTVPVRPDLGLGCAERDTVLDLGIDTNPC